MNEDTLRKEFEHQHAGRDLSKHRLRGTYLRAPIAALWNQHVRTACWLEHRMGPDANETLRIENRVLLKTYKKLKESIQPTNNDVKTESIE